MSSALQGLGDVISATADLASQAVPGTALELAALGVCGALYALTDVIADVIADACAAAVKDPAAARELAVSLAMVRNGAMQGRAALASREDAAEVAVEAGRRRYAEGYADGEAAERKRASRAGRRRAGGASLELVRVSA